jgi:hypothetical protein
MSRDPNPENIRVRKNKFPPKAQHPYISHEPWAGFTRHDCLRENPLPACPSPRCRRAKACIASHDTLYCRRTHFSPAEQKKWQRRDPHRRELAAVPEVADPHDLEERLERVAELAAIRRAQVAEMTARWKAGEFDQLYGSYTPKGVLMKPPPKTYVEWPAKGLAHAFKDYVCTKSGPRLSSG